MLPYCFKCRKNTESKNTKDVRTESGRIMLFSKCVACDSKSKFITEQEASTRYKMNEVIKKILLAGEKFMPEMHLRQIGFTYGACEPFTKNKERIKKFKEIGDSSYIYQNELDKDCF